jgi:dihydrofolate reductase
VISIVVARASNGVIGRDGELPWRLPSDMRYFRELTTGHTVVMGRKTFESLPSKYRPLPDRRNLVLSATPHRELPGAEVFPDLPSALTACKRDCFVIGGGAVYRDALPFADRVYATEIEQEIEGDTYFPELSPSHWRRVQGDEPIVENELAFAFVQYERTS